LKYIPYILIGGALSYVFWQVYTSGLGSASQTSVTGVRASSSALPTGTTG